MHGTTMVFLVGMPFFAGLANYLVPLMIGARDMAFPRLNAFGYWMFLFGGLLLYFSYIGRRRVGGPRDRARRGVVRLRTADRARVLTRHQHGLLDSQHHRQRYRKHGKRDQRDRDHLQHALQRHDAGSHAAVRVADAGGLLRWCLWRFRL
jgi:hypothetical protein